MNPKEIIKEIKDIIDKLLRYRVLSETYWITLKKDGNKTWALVFAWKEGFDDNHIVSGYQFNDCRICGKVAYNDSYMKDYNMDWIMPSKDDAVYDTECSIEEEADISSAIAYWENCWADVQANYM